MPPVAKIVSVDYPSEASPSQEITVTVVVHNQGDTGTIFARAYTPDGFRGSTFYNVSTCSNVTVGIIFYMPAEDVTITIEAGSGTAYSPIEVTDTRTIYIRVKRESTSRFDLKIVSIDAPSEAPPNENIFIKINVKNVGDGGNGWLWLYIDDMLYYVYNFGYIEGGGERSFTYGIIMPDKDIKVTVYVGEGMASSPVSVTDTKTIYIKKKVVVGVFNLVVEKIDFPSTAKAGSYVSGTIYLRNTGGDGYGYIKVHVYDSISTITTSEYNFGLIYGGASRSYSLSFYIFSRDVIIDIEVGEGTVSNPVRVTDKKRHIIKVDVSIPTHLSLELEYPEKVKVGDTVSVKAIAINSGDAGKGYIRFIVSALDIEKLYTFDIGKNQSVERSISFTMPSTTVIGTVEAGVVKDGEYKTTSVRLFTISPVALPPDVTPPAEEIAKPIEEGVDYTGIAISVIALGGLAGLLYLRSRGE